MIDDIIYHAEQENLDRILFAADMEKAFDSLGHNFLSQPSLNLDLAKNLFSGSGPFCGMAAVVMNNGVSTGYFNLERGAKQGDRLSPYLFILCLETLFIQIRNDKSIRGFKFRKLRSS